MSSKMFEEDKEIKKRKLIYKNILIYKERLQKDRRMP